MPRVLSVICLVAFLPVIAGAQLTESKHRLRGVIRDQTGAVMPGLSLGSANKGEKGYGGLTDINGEFTLELSPGDHRITSSQLPESSFTVFLRIVETAPNPEFIELVTDSSPLCVTALKQRYPEIVKSSLPKFPPAARAVRALGTVVVKTRIGLDGRVMSATTVSGHPLLRKAAESAALLFEFNPSQVKTEIDLPLYFVFIDSSWPAKDVPRYSCPFRIVLNAKPSRVS